MKSLVILMLITSYSIYAIDNEANPFSFNYNANGQTKKNDTCLSSLLFPQDKFLLGFQWTGTGKMMSALKCNADADNNIEHPRSDFETIIPLYSITQPGEDGIAAHPPFLRSAASIYYKPCLKITNPGEFKTIEGDVSNPVFGFNYTQYSI
jgi:hypothetical protein